MFTVPGTSTTLPATVVPHRPTQADNAWMDHYTTVVLTGEVVAVRVHAGAGEGAAVVKARVIGAGLKGRWFAIGDFIQNYREYLDSHALPADFTMQALATFLPGTVLNVGLCGPLFGRPGGAEQAEFVDGPDPLLQPIDAVWSRYTGHA
jgi:hypothetical protein